MILGDKIQDQFDNIPNLKVLFFFDNEKEYAEEIESLKITGIKLSSLSLRSSDSDLTLDFAYAVSGTSGEFSFTISSLAP